MLVNFGHLYTCIVNELSIATYRAALVMSPSVLGQVLVHNGERKLLCRGMKDVEEWKGAWGFTFGIEGLDNVEMQRMETTWRLSGDAEV
jgi:hypothetical protein